MNDSQYYDYIVVGCGGVGSSALYRLAKQARGRKVLGLEQFELGHHNGGSQDFSRVIRYTYPDPTYVSLAVGAFKAWREVEEESGIQIFHKCGALTIAKKNSKAEGNLRKIGRVMDAASIDYELLEGFGVHKKFPSFTPMSDVIGMYQNDEGLLDAALANAVHIQLARKHGADILEHTSVKKITRGSDGILQLLTSNGVFRCRKVIVAAGAWINDVTRSIGVHVPVTVTQEQVTYFATPHMKEFSHRRFPCFAFSGDDRLFYTIPIYGNTGFKIGIDGGGAEVTARTRTFRPNPKIIEDCRALLKEFVPRSLGPILYTKTCLYTMTADRDFVIDTAHRTGYPDVAVCCGAGHIFKFAAVVGKILADIAMDRMVSYDIARFRLDRPAIMDPNFKKHFDLMDDDKEQLDVKAKL